MSEQNRLLDSVPSSVSVPVGAAVTILCFLFAVQLLGTATDAAAPTLRRLLRRVVVGDWSALGLGWLAAYGLGNGSVVAAIALSLFDSGLVTRAQLYLLVAGSRLGAAGIVVVVGAVDYVQKERYTLRESVSMGVLTFLVTHSIYLPATLLGYLGLAAFERPLVGVGESWTIGVEPLAVFDPLTEGITEAIGPALALLLAVAVLFGSLRLFDRVLGRVDTETIRTRLFRHFRRTWLSFLIGLLVTLVTTSVAFSLGVIVPLYNRGYVKREELVPYVLGANLGTLVDTLVVAVVLGTPVGTATVLWLILVASGVTLVALALGDRYVRVVEAADDRILTDRRAFVAFAVSLVVVPLALVVVSLAVG
jgi:sodium-dependent phosphate cotransporter